MPEDLFADAFNEDGDTDLDSDISLPFNEDGDPLDTLGEETKHEDECQQTKEKKGAVAKKRRGGTQPSTATKRAKARQFLKLTQVVEASGAKVPCIFVTPLAAAVCTKCKKMGSNGQVAIPLWPQFTATWKDVAFKGRRWLATQRTAAEIFATLQQHINLFLPKLALGIQVAITYATGKQS